MSLKQKEVRKSLSRMLLTTPELYMGLAWFFMVVFVTALIDPSDIPDNSVKFSAVAVGIFMVRIGGLITGALLIYKAFVRALS